MIWDDNLVLHIRQGDNTEAQKILEEINPCDIEDISSSTTLLHVAADCGNLVMTNYLLDKDCKVDAVDDLGNTPLLLASFRDHNDVIHKLTESKASVLISNKFGQNAAKIIFGAGGITKYDRAILTLLLKKVKEECFNDSMQTAKKLIEVHCSLRELINLREPEITKCMIEIGCKVNDQGTGECDSSALHLAVELSDIQNVKILVNYGANVNAEDWAHRTPITSINGRTKENCEILKILLDYGAHVTDNNGRLLLTFIFECGKKETIVELFMKYKLDLMARTVNFYEERLVHLLVRNRNFDCTEILMNQSFDVNVRSHNETGVLEWALYSDNPRVIKYLLAKGADEPRIPAFLLAIYNCYFKVYSENIGLKYIEIFLDHGSDPQLIASHNRTVFDVTLAMNGFALIKPILAHLALIEAHGNEIKKIILTQIKAHRMFRNYFDLCKHAIEKMKRTKIHQSVTLFQCLTETRVEKFMKLVRNEKLVLIMKSIMYFKRRSKHHYHKMLRKRVMDIVKIAKSRKSCVEILSNIQELRMNTIVIEKIADYVIFDDVKATVGGKTLKSH